MSTFGNGTFGSGTFGTLGASSGNTTAEPTGINDLIGQDDPSATFVAATTPDGVNDATTLDAPTATFAAAATPGAVNDLIGLDPPTVTFTAAATPDGINDALTLDSPTSAPILPIGEFVDDFTTDTIAANWPGSFGTFSITGGRGRVQSATDYSALATAPKYTLAGSSVHARIYPPGNTGTGVYTEMTVTSNVGGTALSIEISGTAAAGSIQFKSTVGYSDPGQTFITYDPAAHAYLRIAESGGTVTFATSPDAATWTTQRTIATPAWATTGTDLKLVLQAHRDTGTTDYAEFDNINVVPATITPTGINDATTVDDPTAAFAATVAVDEGPAELLVSDAPTADTATVAAPDGIAEPVDSDAPALVLDLAATPDGINDTVTSDNPAAVSASTTTVDDGPQAGIATDDPAVAFTMAATPTGINDLTGLDLPAVGFNTAATVGDLSAGVAADNPSAAYLRTPTGVNDGVTVDAPTASVVVTPTSIAAPVANDPVVLGYLGGPASINDALSMGAPTASMVVVPTSITLTITNGTAPTTGQLAQVGDGPAIKPVPGATITVTFVAFTIGPVTPDGIAVDTATNTDVRVTPSHVYPDGIAVPFTIGGTDLPKPVYTPLVPLTRRVPVPPTHLLGIGPWFPNIEWGGAPNHGAPSGIYTVSAPVVNLPTTTSKSFTLRLNGADEARADFEVPRDQAFLIEERSTDLWWRRRDNHRNIVESIGRFNANNVDIASTDDAKIRVSATFADYRAQLEDRLILNYRIGPPTNTSMWEKGTPAADLLRFIIPVNLRLDLSELDTANLGNVVEAIEMNPGRTVGDAMGEIQSLSTYPWEWWIEMPEDSTARPKLRFAAAGRGKNKGVSLVDTGGGESPITSFTMQAAGEKYANTLYYTGTAGGVLIAKMDEVARYGQRDAQESTTGLVGNLAAITKAGNQRLSELLQRPLSWSLTLREGYWEGRSHIDVGDVIGVSIRFGKQMLSDNYRVSEIAGSIEDDGRETVTISVGPPRPARDPRSRYSAIGKLVRTIKDPVTHDTTPAPKLGETPYITVDPWYGTGDPPVN